MFNINFLQVAIFFTLSHSTTTAREPKCGDLEFKGYTSPWGYNPDNGPIMWSNFTCIPGGVGDNVHVCSTARVGTHQSPVVIRPSVMNKADKQTKLGWDLGEEVRKFELEYDGHTVEATPEDKHSLISTLNGDPWELEQFHFHTPSEHTYGSGIDGTPVRYPLEVHFVHSAGNKKAVLGIWFKLDDYKKNHFLEEVTKDMQGLRKCDKKKIVLSNETFGQVQEFVDAYATIGESQITTYEGSLTTPPCTEGVNWFVVQEPMTISHAQLMKFESVLSHNSRCTKSEWKQEGWSIDVNGSLNNCGYSK